MPPPPSEPFATRLLLGPALRTQPDRRLVGLVRDGYEAAFEEIVRRYRKPLDRFAAGFVGSRSEDVTQDAFSKALLALRGTTTEIELKPWLYRIVRNTALNDIRDRPPTVEQLEETLAGGESAAVEAERREEMTELMARLRALPEPQRAAIVMRELEGLSHDEIAASLGVSGGAARQAIYRARASLRNGLGLLVPLPLLRALIDHGGAAEAAGGAAAAGMATSAAGAAGAGLGGIGAGGAVKAGLATVLVAGSLGAAGVAIEHERGGRGGPDTAAAAATNGPQAGAGSAGASASGASTSGASGFEPDDDRGARGEAEPGDDRGERDGDDDRRGDDRSGPGGGSGGNLSSGRGSGDDDEDTGRHFGSGRGSGSGRGDDSGHGTRSGSGGSGSGSGHSGSGGSGSGSGHSGSGDSGTKHSGSDDSGGDDGSHHGGSGSGSSGAGVDDGLEDDSSAVESPPPPVVEEPDDSDSGDDD